MIWCLQSRNKEEFIIWIWIEDDCSVFETENCFEKKTFRRREFENILCELKRGFWTSKEKQKFKASKAAISISQMFAE